MDFANRFANKRRQLLNITKELIDLADKSKAGIDVSMELLEVASKSIDVQSEIGSLVVEKVNCDVDVLNKLLLLI